MHYADTRGELVEYKDARQGATEDAFWSEDELVSPRKTKKKKKPRKKGCPGNDNKAHVYTWITETRYYSKWGYHGFVEDKSRPYTVDKKICCGCEKIANVKFNW